MSISTIRTSITQMNEKLEETKRVFSEQIREYFYSYIKEYFKENTEVQAIIWTQYTPYWMDGEPCEFSVHEPYVILDGFDRENLPYTPYECEEEELYTIDYNKSSEFCSLLMEIEDVLEFAFGDHVIVIVTPTEVIVNEYEHY